MTIDTTYLDSGADKIKLARPAIMAMAQEINAIEASGGSALIGHLPAGTGAIASEISAELDRGFVYAQNFATLQAAIDAAAASHQKTLVLEAGATYVSASNLSITTSGLKIIGNGATIDGSARLVGSNALDTFGLSITGSAGSNVNITADIAEGDNRINITSTTGIVAGDYLLLKTTQQYPTGATGTASYKGGIYQVRSVTNSTELVLQEGALFSMTALVSGSQNAYIAKLTLVEDVQIDGLKIKMGGTAKAHVGIKISYALNPRLTNCETSATESVGVFAEYVVGGGVYGGEFSGATSPAAGGGAISSQYGYGICPGSATKFFTVSGSSLKNCRHCIAGGGTYPSVGVVIERNKVDGTRLATATHGASYALDCHEDCTHWIFNGNIVFSHKQANSGAYVDGDGGIIVRGRNVTVVNNKIFNMAQCGIRVRNADGAASFSSGNIISGNTIGGCLQSGILIEGGGSTALEYDHLVTNNIIYDCSVNGIQLTSASNVVVSSNKIQCNSIGQRGISIDGSASNYSSNIVIDGNCISNPTSPGIFSDYARNMTISNNRITASNDDGIQLWACLDIAISGNVISTDVDIADGISVTGSSARVSITGCILTKTVTAGTASAGVKVSASTDVTAGNCIANGFINGFSVDSTSDYVSVTGCNGRNCTTSVSINGAVVNKVNANNL